MLIQRNVKGEKYHADTAGAQIVLSDLFVN